MAEKRIDRHIIEHTFDENGQVKFIEKTYDDGTRTMEWVAKACAPAVSFWKDNQFVFEIKKVGSE
jgi:hypothetical protein